VLCLFKTENSILGLKGLCNIAQGNALGADAPQAITALKGQDKKANQLYCPFRAKMGVVMFQTQGVALG
jgi:hypothetical protein